MHDILICIWSVVRFFLGIFCMIANFIFKQPLLYIPVILFIAFKVIQAKIQ